MEDALWEMVPHTKAKHEILRRYVEAWAPILSQGGYNGRLAYIDGFAGPGKYKGGEDGSPVVVLNALRNHIARDRFKSEFVNIFVEKNQERSEVLETTIKERCSPLPVWMKYEVINGEFNQVLSGILSNLEEKGEELVPCLCFVDPFGWSDLDYSILTNFMKYEKAELLITFMAGYLSRFVWDEVHMASIKKLFTDEQIAEIKQSTDREATIMRLFLDNLRRKMKASGINSDLFHLAFAAYNAHNRLEYYLIYVSKNCKGFEVMKAAMFNAARDGSFKFNDFDFNPSQKTLVDYGGESPWVQQAAEELYGYLKKLSERTLPPEFAEILKDFINSDESIRIPTKILKNFITCRTIWKYEKSILEYLEDTGKMTVHIPERRGKTYPDRGYVTVN